METMTTTKRIEIDEWGGESYYGVVDIYSDDSAEANTWQSLCRGIAGEYTTPDGRRISFPPYDSVPQYGFGSLDGDGEHHYMLIDEANKVVWAINAIWPNIRALPYQLVGITDA